MTVCKKEDVNEMLNFNSHPHAGGDRADAVDCREYIISTHTPTQGVTERGHGNRK